MSQIYDPMNWKIIVSIIVVVVIAVVAYSWLGGMSPNQEGVAVVPSNTGENMQPGDMKGGEKIPATPVNPGPPDAVVDPAVDAIVAAADADASLTSAEDSDAALISADSQAIGDIGQAYSNNEL